MPTAYLPGSSKFTRRTVPNTQSLPGPRAPQPSFLCRDREGCIRSGTRRFVMSLPVLQVADASVKSWAVFDGGISTQTSRRFAGWEVGRDRRGARAACVGTHRRGLRPPRSRRRISGPSGRPGYDRAFGSVMLSYIAHGGPGPEGPGDAFPHMQPRAPRRSRPHFPSATGAMSALICRPSKRPTTSRCFRT